MKLRSIAHSRSGDKGSVAKISLIAYSPHGYPRLVREVTADRVKAWFGPLVEGRVHRYELPTLGALNFVLHGVVGGGVNADARPRCARQVVQLGPAGDGDP